MRTDEKPWQALLPIFGIALVSLIAVAIPILQPPPVRATPRLPAQPANERTPASLAGPDPTAKIDSAETNQLLNVGCVDTGRGETQFTSDAAHVRLRGDVCQRGDNRPSRGFVGSQVALSDGGSDAMVFYPKAHSFTTELIALREGTNTVRMRHQLMDGSVLERNIVVLRRPARLAPRVGW